MDITDMNSSEYRMLLLKNKKLELENTHLKEQLSSAHNEWSQNIDMFVEKWFEENNDTIDVGINLNLNICSVDVFSK